MRVRARRVPDPLATCYPDDDVAAFVAPRKGHVGFDTAILEERFHRPVSSARVKSSASLAAFMILGAKLRAAGPCDVARCCAVSLASASRKLCCACPWRISRASLSP